LEIKNDKTILVFQESQSVSFTKNDSYYNWIYSHLDELVINTGFRPIIVAYGEQPDHPKYETWRGTLEDYQRLIAQCGMVYGIITSAHVLGQLLGKPVFALYRAKQSIVDTIGQEYSCSFIQEEV
jgi:NAD-dependent SIR2 family protein deacetylase